MTKQEKNLNYIMEKTYITNKQNNYLEWNKDFFNFSLYEWIDLDLPSGLKWSAWNVGATKPEEYGSYFQWNDYIINELISVTDNLCRIPTKTEIEELILNTTSQWVDNYNNKNIAGRIFTSNKNKNSIFIPAAGRYCEDLIKNIGECGDLWASSLCEFNYENAFAFHFGLYGFGINGNDCSFGMSLRPVF